MKYYAFEIETTKGRKVRAYRGANYGNAKAKAEAKQDVIHLIRYEEISERQFERVVETSGQNDKTYKTVHVTVNRRLR